MIGKTLGPYQVFAKLGEGGMGEVYRARDTKLNRDVAIKILPDAFADDTERVARFMREAQTLASLNHPNIAQIYGILEEPASPRDPARHVHALVMELVEGEDLSQRIARGAIPLDEALPIAGQIADALEAAHEQGIVHRDLKPANIKVREDGTVKVLDFGLARAADRFGMSSPDQANSPTMVSPAMTATGMIMGTAAYMSPEQAKGKAVDKRADIWAFGVVLHEMLTGVRLFTGDSVTETLAAVLTHEADLTDLPRATPSPVASLLRRCLERDPKRRLRDIGEARLLLSGQIDAAPVASPESQPGRWNMQRLLLAVVLAGVGFAAGFGVASMAGRSVREASAGAVLTVMPLTASGNVISATVSPDGRHIAYVESEQGRQSLWIQQVAGGQSLRLIPDQNVAYWSHAFTPDGNDIVYGLKSNDDPEGALYSISMLGGSPKRLVGNIDSAPTYSPDGRRMAYLRLRHPSLDQTSLMVAGADGSNPTALMSVRLPEYVAGIFFGGPAWSPDGKTIVTSLGRRGSAGSDVRATLIQVSVETGAVSTLADPGWLVAAQAAWLPDGKSLLVIARTPDQLAAQIWSVSYPDGESRRVTSDLNDHRIVSLTRDGRTLVSISGIVSASVLTLPRHGGRPVRVSRSTQDGLQGVAFAADGSIV
jgi:serine/threonine protein kinase